MTPDPRTTRRPRAVTLASTTTAAALLAATTVSACTHDSSASAPEPEVTTASSAPTTAPGRTGASSIRLTLDGTTVDATLNDSATARDFASHLPLTLRLTDFNQAEKTGDLPSRLSTAGASEGADPRVGDIAYYAPWGTLATYYHDAPYAAGLVIIGHMTYDGAERLRTADEITIRPAA
ncbi:cyclophilin-like fold protein [Streptomyces sp. NPDC017673]|uniref:cyclophilin-like fold protein n=1 Tax=unclassified Streptomyces TaxID=2593676 RepID=UPI0037B1D402